MLIKLHSTLLNATFSEPCEQRVERSEASGEAGLEKGKSGHRWLPSLADIFPI